MCCCCVNSVYFVISVPAVCTKLEVCASLTRYKPGLEGLGTISGCFSIKVGSYESVIAVCVHEVGCYESFIAVCTCVHQVGCYESFIAVCVHQVGSYESFIAVCVCTHPASGELL